MARKNSHVLVDDLLSEDALKAIIVEDLGYWDEVHREDLRRVRRLMVAALDVCDKKIAERTELARAAKTRKFDPDTSHAAALSITDLKDKQIEVLCQFTKRPNDMVPFSAKTDEQIYYDVLYLHQGGKVSQSGPRSRRAELTEAGLVAYTGRKVKNSAGRLVRTYRITPAGVDLLRQAGRIK